MKFTYREIPISISPSTRRKKNIYRPIIPVILVNNKTLVGYEAMIDSGSDYNVFDAKIATILKINLIKGKKRKILGIGEQALKGYEHKVSLKIAGKQYTSTIIFSQQIPPNSFGILGQQGFFDQFCVTFNYKQKYVEIS